MSSSCMFRLCRERKLECGPMARLRFYPNAAAMHVNNLFAQRKANAGAGVIRWGVKALNNHEDALVVLPGNANAIVPHGKDPESIVATGRGEHLRRGRRTRLQGVSDRVL